MHKISSVYMPLHKKWISERKKISHQFTFPQVTEQADHSPKIYFPGIGQD